MIPEKKPEHENNGKKNHLINEKSPYFFLLDILPATGAMLWLMNHLKIQKLEN